MTATLDQYYAALADKTTGLIYRQPLGPALPSINTVGLGYIRDDLLAQAAGAEQQGAAADAAGNHTLGVICETTARVCRDAARNIVTYALDPTWSVSA